MVEKNGVEDLIEAIKILDRNDIVLKILGDGKLRKKLEKLVKDLEIKDRVALLGEKQFQLKGEVSNKAVYERLMCADVFCRPSLSEGLGNAFLEAMAVGVPVIATPVGGIPDFLKDGETGWFCEPRNPKSIVEKIKYILDEKNNIRHAHFRQVFKAGSGNSDRREYYNRKGFKFIEVQSDGKRGKS